MAEAAMERALAEGLEELEWAALPEGVRRRTALFILDTLGAIGGAREAPGVPALHAAIGGWETDGVASVLLAGHGASPATAALLNGASAHALEFDDQHDPARIHAFCVVLPAALAAAEAAGGVSGQRLLLSVAVGVELFCRLGLACHDALGQGWHPTTMFGGMAGAAAAAKVWGLDSTQTGNALAIAYAQLCGNNQSLFDNVLSKRIGPGFAARNAVTAALLARAGLSGPRNFLNGKAGLFKQYARDVAAPDILTDRLGAYWRLEELSMKPFPCCRCQHTVLGMATRLHAEGVRPEDVRSVEIGLSAVNHSMVGGAFDAAAADPVVHGQFNIRYGFARALTDGRIGVDSFQADKVRAADVTALIARTETVAAPDVPVSATEPARLRLVMADGTERRIARDTMPGSPDEPLSEAEVLAKFRTNLAWGFGTGTAMADGFATEILALAEASEIGFIGRGFRALSPAPVRAAG